MNLSVVVPIYGVENYIEKCAISLFEQSLSGIEYIFVNDKSKDSSIEILEQVIDRYPHLKDSIKIINHEVNRGLAAARATGLKHCTGDYVITCDSDDWIDTDLYKEMYSLAMVKKADIVCCDFKLFYDSHVNTLNFDYNEKKFLDLNNLQFNILYASLCNKMIKRDLYMSNKIAPFNNINMWEDLGVTTRLRYHCKRVAFLKKELYYNYNKQNQNSIVYIPKEENIEQQIECAKLLEIFFKTKGKNYDIVAAYLKFLSKSDYLYNKKVRNIEKWQAIYPEVNQYIFKFINLPLNIKSIAYLAANNKLFLLDKVLLLREFTIGLRNNFFDKLH